MKKFLPILLLLALALVAGCGGQSDEAEEAPATTEEAAAPAAAEEAAEAAVLTCSACGMEMAADQMVTVDGKVYCSHCSPETEAEHDHDAHDGHDHG